VFNGDFVPFHSQGTRFVCCNCGLTHILKLAINEKKGVIGMRVWRGRKVKRAK
jgi:hypothetical protein